MHEVNIQNWITNTYETCSLETIIVKTKKISNRESHGTPPPGVRLSNGSDKSVNSVHSGYKPNKNL